MKSELEPYKKPEVKSCLGCKFFASRAYGYSDYTIDYSRDFCLKNKFDLECISDKQAEEFYSKCSEFRQVHKEQVNLSVEDVYMIEDYQEDEELFDALMNFEDKEL